MISTRSLLLMLAALPTMAVAAEPGTVSLSPAERAAAIDAASRMPDEALDTGVAARGVHGEMGFEIGSRGERALFGTTVVPLGQTGVASFSFLTGQSGRWRVR